MLPNFAIIGAQKAASSAFQECLMRHPHVFMAPGEVRYFENPEHEATSESEFEALFEGAFNAKAVGIKRPDYLARPECAPNLHRLLPHAKLIAILRDPVDRAVSAYFHQMKYGFIPVRPLEEGLSRIIAGEYDYRYPKSAEILEYGFYKRHLLHYLEYFRPEQLLVLRVEDLRRNPIESVRKAFRFLHVDDSFACEMPMSKTKRNAGIYSLARLRLLQLRNRLAYKYNSDRTKIDFDRRPNGIRRVTGRSIQAADRFLLSGVLANGMPKLSESMRRQLAELYDEDLRGLEALLGWNLSSWRTAGNPTVADPEFEEDASRFPWTLGVASEWAS